MSPAASPEPPVRWRGVFNTLFGEILLWLLIILLFAWSIGIVMIYYISGKIANEPYDNMLADNVRAIVKQIDVSKGKININLPPSVQDLLHTDVRDKVYFQISRDRDELIAGDAEVPWVYKSNPIPNTVLLRDDDIDGNEVRIAYTFVMVPGGSPLLVQVGETLNKRVAMAARVVSGVIVPQFAIVPLSVLLIYLAVSRGVTPLHRLQDELKLRRPSDLSPISQNGIPAEISPLIEALNETMGRLDDSLRGQRQFIADAAHQLKTPLTGLRTQVELAAAETSPEGVRACVEQMTKAISRLSNMTQKLLMLARAEAMEEHAAAFEPIDLNAFVPEVAREWAPNALTRHIDFGFDTTVSEARISGVPVLLQEMFSNLLDNAIRYTPEGGAISIHLLSFGQGIAVEIDDTGMGIPAAERERVFSRFHRVLGTGIEGSGLGLAIVREIAALHSAVVSIHEGRSGKGTLVRVAFSSVPSSMVEVSNT